MSLILDDNTGMPKGRITIRLNSIVVHHGLGLVSNWPIKWHLATTQYSFQDKMKSGGVCALAMY